MNSRPILLLVIVVFLLKLLQLPGNSGLYPLWSHSQEPAGACWVCQSVVASAPSCEMRGGRVLARG